VKAVAASVGSNSNSKEKEATIDWRQHAVVFLVTPRMTEKGILNRCNNQSIYWQQQWQQQALVVTATANERKQQWTSDSIKWYKSHFWQLP